MLPSTTLRVARAIGAAALALTLAPCGSGLRAQSSPSIGPVPAVLDIGVGQVATITVVLEGALVTDGIEVRGSFDPSVIEIVAAAPDSPLTAGGFIKPDVVVSNAVDELAGTFQWSASQVSPSVPARGSGPVFIAQIRGKAAGRSTAFEITSVGISDRSGQVMIVTRRSGTIKVLGSPVSVTSTAASPKPTLPAPGNITPTAVPPTQPPATPTQPSTPTPAPSPTLAATATPDTARRGQATPTGIPTSTRAVVNVTAQPAVTAVPAALAATPNFAAPGATPNAPRMQTAPATPAASSFGSGASPTPALEMLAAAARAGQPPGGPGSQLPGGAAVPGQADSPSAGLAPASAADPVTGLVLVAIGLATLFGFGAADRQGRGRPK